MNRGTVIQACLILAMMLVTATLHATDPEPNFLIEDSFLPANCTWMFEPREDITAYELALILPAFTAFRKDEAFPVLESLPETAKRHFRRENCDK